VWVILWHDGRAKSEGKNELDKWSVKMEPEGAAHED